MNEAFPHAAGLTDAGVQRQNNEDSWSGPPSDLAPEMLAAKGFLYVVADGVGGHQGGEVASRIAAQVTQEVYYGDSNNGVGASLRLAIEEANRRIYHQGISSPNEYGMSTTITAAVVRGNEVFAANVGDSRTYLIHEGTAHQLTTDHTLVEEQRQAGILSAQEAANHPRRNVITRSLGAELRASVDVFEPHPLTPGDHLLLCSDGLSDLVSEREIAHIITQSRSPSAAVRRLVDLAKKRGAPDNVTAVVIQAGRNRTRASSRAPSPLGNFAALGAALGAVVLLAGTIAALRGMLPWQVRSTVKAPPATPTAPQTGTSSTLALTPTLPALQAATLLKPADGITYTEQEEVKLEWGWPLTLTTKQRFVLQITANEAPVISKTVRVGEEMAYTGEELDPGIYQWQVHVEEVVDNSWKLLPGTRSEIRTFEVVRPTPTPVPTATPTPQPQAETPILLKPEQGSTQQNPITFQWEGSLGPGQSYRVEAHHADTESALMKEGLQESILIQGVPAESIGQWTWAASVIQDGVVITTSEEGMFWFNPLPGGGGDSDEETPDSTPER